MRRCQMCVQVALLAAVWHPALPAQTPDPAALTGPDTTLVLEARPDLVRVRLAQPGYVLVFAVRSDESWYLAYPQPNDSLSFTSDPQSTLTLWRPRHRVGPPSLSSPRPSDAICDHAAGSPADGFCDVALAQAMKTSGFQAVEPTVTGYLVIELSQRAHLRTMFRGMAKNPRPREVVLETWILREVSSNAPVKAWSTTDITP